MYGSTSGATIVLSPTTIGEFSEESTSDDAGRSSSLASSLCSSASSLVSNSEYYSNITDYSTISSSSSISSMSSTDNEYQSGKDDHQNSVYFQKYI